MKFKAIIKHEVMRECVRNGLLRDLGDNYLGNRYVKGYYVDGFIVGGFVEVNDEYTALEYWIPVDKDTVQPIEEVKADDRI